MGDLNAVDFVSLAHLRLLREAGCVRPEEWAVYRLPPPEGNVWEGVMIDDHAWVYRVSPWPERDGRQRAAEVEEASVAAYERVGLARAPRKEVRGAARADVCGATFDGDHGTVAAADSIRARALELSLRVLELPLVSAFLLSSVLGLWAHVLLFRRGGFALVDELFRLARSMDGGVFFPLTSRARSELLSLVILAPGFVADLRARVDTRLTATDASSRWAAIVEAEAPVELVDELWRWRVRRGGYVRCETGPEATIRECLSSDCLEEAVVGLLAEAMAEREPPGREDAARLAADAALRGVVGEVADSLAFRERTRYRVKVEFHINKKESFPIARSIREDAADPARQDTRQLKLVDSSVNSRGWAKGRSSSYVLNRVMQPTVGEQLLGGIQPGFLPIPTQQNPADDPTRGSRVRRPARASLPSVAEIRGRLEAHSARGAAAELLTCRAYP